MNSSTSPSPSIGDNIGATKLKNHRMNTEQANAEIEWLEHIFSKDCRPGALIESHLAAATVVPAFQFAPPPPPRPIRTTRQIAPARVSLRVMFIVPAIILMRPRTTATRVNTV